MAAKDRSSSGGSGFGKAGEAARAARSNRYMERLIEDEELRGNLLAAYGAARSAYGRMSNGKPASKALFEDRKLQHELRDAANALRDAASTLREPPRKARRRRGGLGRTLLLLDRRRARAGAQRGSAREGARPVVRRRGGVRVQLDHRSGRAGAGVRAGLLSRPGSAEIARWPPSVVIAATTEAADARKVAARKKPRGVAVEGEKAQRIVEAMRRSVARRGTAGSTFDHVAREAGVSRGLLHYYFGTKEQLLVEAVRRDCELRMELLEQQLAGARTADDFIGLMAQNLQETVREDPDFVTLVFELFTLSRRNADIAVEYAELMRRTREQVADMLAIAQREGVVRLHAEPDAVAEILFSLGDGFALRMLTEPERDFEATVRAGIACARALLAD